MKIIILGAGQVGGSLALSLANESNDITLVDSDPKVLREIQDRADLQTITGHASYPSILEQAGARDAINTTLYGLLTNPDQLEDVKRLEDWDKAFEEGIRWVAPISASSRLVTEDTEIKGFLIPKGDTVMTIQASAKAPTGMKMWSRTARFLRFTERKVRTNPLGTDRISVRVHM